MYDQYNDYQHKNSPQINILINVPLKYLLYIQKMVLDEVSQTVKQSQKKQLKIPSLSQERLLQILRRHINTKNILTK